MPCVLRQLTTSGGRKHSHDGTRGPARVRYECHYKKRHPRECDGPTGYGQVKLDPIVDKMVRMKFAEIKATPRRDVILEQKQKEISQHKTAVNRLMTINRTKQKEVEDYKAEIIKVIRGESKLNPVFVIFPSSVLKSLFFPKSLIMIYPLQIRIMLYPHYFFTTIVRMTRSSSP